jgi:hypothetical protein
MDVANSLLPIYQKVGNDWLLLCNLKVPPSGGGGGSGGAAGGGGSVILFPSPLPGVPGPDKPTVDNDGNSLNKGDVWFDTTTGWLYVWNGSQWVAVSDRPPVIISPTSPIYNNSSDEDPAKNPQYPVREGDLWFDSEQLATYVAVKNSADDLVWIITTPHNREGLAAEIPVFAGESIPFAFPRAADRDVAYNPVTDTEYIYNASKNQWVDISQMVHYGDKPPAHAPIGALFTDAATLKQFTQTSPGIWVENTSCGAGAGTAVEEPWIYISDFRTTRVYESNAWGSSKNKQRIIFYEWHYNDRYESTVTSEWEWDELGDGNWVSYNPVNDPYALTNHNFTNNNYWEYFWAPESADGAGPIDPAHPHPCTKLRGRLINTWNDGKSKTSDWVECYLGRSAVPANGDTLKPPSVCTP